MDKWTIKYGDAIEEPSAIAMADKMKSISRQVNINVQYMIYDI